MDYETIKRIDMLTEHLYVGLEQHENRITAIEEKLGLKAKAKKKNTK